MSDRTALDRLSWHDNLIYGLHLRCPDPERGVWRSDLILDIDHIVEWVRSKNARVRFRVAPATLVFHDVGDLRIDVDFKGHGEALNELSIAEITHEPSDLPANRMGRERWRIALSMPAGSEIAFVASGYTQSLRGAARLVEEQRLPPGERNALVLDP
jgi:hypothetical protein